MILESKEKFPPGLVLFGSWTVISEKDIVQKLPNCMVRIEELFFKIVTYLPERDRYVVERIDSGYIATGCLETKSMRMDLEVRVTKELRDEIFDSCDDDDYYKRIKEKKILTREMMSFEISDEEYKQKLAEIKKEYSSVKKRIEIGSVADLNCSLHPEKSYLSKDSWFLKVGDQITAKRKNIHFVQDEQCTNLTYYKSKYVTTWDGVEISVKLLELLGPGNVVRVSTEEVGCVYMAITRVEKEGFVGFLLPNYLSDHPTAIGQYHFFPKSAIIEIPHSWRENSSIERAVAKGMKDIRHCMTGMQY